MNNPSKNHKKIQGQQDAEIILQKFKDYDLLTNCNDTGAILLSTKFLFEMEPYLKEKYKDYLYHCVACSKEDLPKIVLRPVQCSNDKCEANYHYYCAHKKILKNEPCAVKLSNGKICGTKLPNRQELYEDVREDVRKSQQNSGYRAGQKRKKEEYSSESD